MISLERSASIRFSVHSLYYFTWLRNILYSSRWIFNNLIKLTKILWKKNQCNRFYFISLEARAVLRLLVSIKILWQYKKLPWDKFVRKKKHFGKYLVVCKIFRAAMFNWWFSRFFRITNVYQFVDSKYYLMKWIGGPGAKKNLQTIYMV